MGCKRQPERQAGHAAAGTCVSHGADVIDIYTSNVYDRLVEGPSAVVDHEFSPRQDAHGNALLEGASGEGVSAL